MKSGQRLVFVSSTRQGIPVVLLNLVLTPLAHAASGADVLEEVVVTAERRTEDVQNTASSVSVRIGSEMLDQGRYSLQSILEDVPGVLGGAAASALQSTGGGTDVAGAGLTIRGIPSNVGAGGGITSTAPAAAIYVDGVYEGVGGGYDIDQIEVLRGPQGTLYGRSATSGLVAIHTRNPDVDEFGGDATVEIGNYRLQHYAGTVNLPLLEDKLALRVAANEYKRQGYYNDDGGAVENTDARAKLLYKPSEDLSILLGAALQNNADHTGGPSSVPSPDPDTVIYRDSPIGAGKNHFRQYWAELNWKLGIGTLTYQPAVRTWYQKAEVNVVANFNITQTKFTPTDKFITHELRLASNPDARLIWQVGALYYDNYLTNQNSVQFTSGPFNGGLAFQADTTKSTKATGLFAQATYPLADAWRLTGGLRYDYTKVATEEFYIPFLGLSPPLILSGDAGRRTFNNKTYKIRIEHDLAPSNLVYASLSTGFSPGDVQVATCNGPNGIAYACALALDAETLTAYEIGSKNRFLDDRLQVNGDAYYYRYGAFQSMAINTSPYVDGTQQNVTATPFAVPVQAYGAELELLFQLTAAGRLGFNLAWTNAYYVGKSSSISADGQRFDQWTVEDKIISAASTMPTGAGVVPVTANLSYDHRFDLPGGSTLLLHGDARYLSSHVGHLNVAQVDAGAQPSWVRVGEQGLGDVSATWTSANQHLSLTGYVRNATDNRYISAVAIQTIPSSVSGFSFTQAQYEPRTYGLIARVRM